MNDEPDNPISLKTIAAALLLVATGAFVAIAAVGAVLHRVAERALFHPFIHVLALAIVLVSSRAVAQSYETTDEQAAAADLVLQPIEDQPYTYYLSIPQVGKQGKDLRRAIKLMVASSSTQQILERCVPIDVAGPQAAEAMVLRAFGHPSPLGLFPSRLLRINIRDLHWRKEDWDLVAGKRNPYHHGDFAPLVVRGDYLLTVLADQTESDAYLRLPFGGDNIPKTIADVRKFFHVDEDPGLRFGQIEGNSGVSRQGMRWVETWPVPLGFYWQTFDFKKLLQASDPTEHPDGSFVFDASEIIIGGPKFSSRFGIGGALQFYFLTDGKGNIIAKADVAIVEDSTCFRGYREIRNPGSCIQCHEGGLNPLSRNELVEQRKDGVPFWQLARNAEKIELFHTRKTQPFVDRNVIDFRTAVLLSCVEEFETGVQPKDIAASFKSAVNEFDRPVNLFRAALELDTTVQALTQVLYSNQPLPNRLEWLTRGNELQPDGKRSKRGEIPRASFSQEFLGLFDAVHYGKSIQQIPSTEPVKAVESPKPKVQPTKPQRELQPQNYRGGRY